MNEAPTASFRLIGKKIWSQGSISLSKHRLLSVINYEPIRVRRSTFLGHLITLDRKLRRRPIISLYQKAFLLQGFASCPSRAQIAQICSNLNKEKKMQIEILPTWLILFGYSTIVRSGFSY